MKILTNNISEENSCDEFSTFNALGFFDQEILHSNILRYLFDHKENHGMFSYFLELFLKEMEDSDYNQDRGLNFDDLVLSDYSVMREFKLDDCYFDLFIVSPKSKTVILIENKIASDQSRDQLVNYYKKIKEFLPEYKVYPIYMTLRSLNPRTNHYYKADYAMLHSCIQRVLGLIENEACKLFLSQYNNLLYQLDQYYNKKRAV